MHQRRIGRYQVLEEIAVGGQGAVSRAVDPLIDRVVAIIVLKPELTSDGGFLGASTERRPWKFTTEVT